ncbi:hypothetical protein MRX98_16650 [Desulfatitalea sp. M08but]|nr:hypothetical protein [Desulfatitalea alkaliphila]
MKISIIISVSVLLMWMVLLTGCIANGGGAMQDNATEVLGPMTADLTVNNLDNEALAVASLWEERRVVLVFLRHYG